MEPQETVYNRQPDGKFGPGNVANPGGRPRGRSMKQYFQTKFSRMTDAELEEWIKMNKVSSDLVWQMAEGRPKQSVDGGEDLEGNPVPFTMVTLQNVHSGEVPTETVSTPPDPSV